MLAEEVVSALIVALIRAGALDPDDMLAIEGLSEDARAHIEALIVEAAAPSQADWQAEQRRKRLRIVTPDGGKPSP